MATLLRTAAILYLVALSAFAWGLLVGREGLAPWSFIDPYYTGLRAYLTESRRDNIVQQIQYDHQERAAQFDYGGIVRRDQAFADPGYLLLSRYSKEHGQVVVELVAIADNELLHRWQPDVDAILAATPAFDDEVNNTMAYRAQHPLLLPGGDIVVGSGEGPLVRLDACGSIVWAVERHFHHSIEMLDADRLVAPVVVAEGPNDLGVDMRDDGFAVLSLQGDILAEYSLYDILMAAGYRGLIYGVGEFETDRFHLNDVQPIAGTNKVLLSIRNLSSVAALDLDTQKIDWLATGPWINQHDVNPLPDGRVSVFGNDFARGAWVLMQEERSEIYIYDPRSGEVATPFTPALIKSGMHTEYEGRSRILENGDVFVEETGRDRLLRLTAEEGRWEYVNQISDTSTGALHWSRYLAAGELPDISGLKDVTCPAR